MKININNYIDFFVNYYDKSLSNRATEELFLFLKKHPELEQEFYDFLSVPSLTELENIEAFPKKMLLTKNHYDAFDIECIDFIENQLTAEEKSNFLKSLEVSKWKKKTFHIFLATIQQGDMNLKFPKKKIIPYLRKKMIIYTQLIASVLLLLTVLIYALQRHTMQRQYSKKLFTKTIISKPTKPVIYANAFSPKDIVRPENNKEIISNNTIKQKSKEPNNTVKKMSKISPKTMKSLAMLSHPLPEVYPKTIVFPKNDLNTLNDKTPRENTFIDFALNKINHISKNHIRITTDKTKKKIKTITIETNIFTFKKY